MPKHRTPLPPELKELIQLIRHGRLYEVQQWIRDGKPTRLPPEGHFILSPMQAAIRTGFHTMVEVMLEALSKDENMDDLLHEAVRMNRLDLIQLVHRYGVNPKSMCYDCVASTQNPLILRWFEDHGIDLVTDYPLAAAFQSRVRAALGTYMRWRKRIPELQHQADIALRYHAAEGSLKWVCLLLWAGADQKVLGACVDRLILWRVVNAFIDQTSEIVRDAATRGKLLGYAYFSVFHFDYVRINTDMYTKGLKALETLPSAVAISMANEIVIDQINKLGTEFNDYAELNKDSCPDIGRSAARNERMFHETNGKLVDVHWAIIRVLNDLSRVRDEPTNKTSKSEYATFFPMFCDLVYRASVLNGAQYLWDKVSYDEWYVEKIETGEKGISAIKFNLSDPRAEKAKLIGIRRQLVFRSFSKKGNAGRIAAIAMIVEAIMGTCEWHFKLKTSFNCADCERLNEGIATLLRFIGPEDEVLFEMPGPHIDSILAQYSIALALRICRLVLSIKYPSFAPDSQCRNNRFCIPQMLLAEVGKTLNIPKAVVKASIRQIISTLPVRSHLDLSQSPYVFDENNIVAYLAPHFVDDWTEPTRAGLVKGGGLGQLVGSSWENYIGNVVRSYGWTVLGKGIRLKEHGTTVTDIDLLCVKDGLVLAIQSKALYSTGNSTFDQWKSRNVILGGAKQAQKVNDFLSRNPNWIRQSFKETLDISTALQIQSVIMTTSSLFTGWNPLGIPIVSLSYFISLLNGANVFFFNQDGTDLGSRHFTAGKTPTGAELIDLLLRPLDWQIAGEDDEVTFISHALTQTVKILVPDFALSEARLQGNAIAPQA